ncbi:MAG: hypothetical protein GF383_16130 [Candidatus Lokiarchaeota archaeon]|nr:hypothetical protein [Candidatus Lokiarchaeota archaeon]MBD3343260.1 hypothetical protein [Candidatus Lokiarchaeota archaeon]
MVDEKEYLESTEFLDFHRKRVKNLALEIVRDTDSDKEKAIALFYWVRDQIKYNMYTYYPKIRANLKASVTLRRGTGFCMSKAVLLSALARAVSIPARIRMVDIRNNKISRKVIDMLGTNIFYCHGISELKLHNNWVKLTPVFDKETALKAGFIPLIEFDGEHNALFSKYDEEGNLFVEYVKDYGSFADVPIDKIDKIFEEHYEKWYSNPDLAF